MDKESTLKIRIEEDVKERAHVVALSLGYTLSEYVLHLINSDINQREEEVELEARRYLDDIQEWSGRCGKPVSELLNRIESLTKPPTTQKTASEIAQELERDGKRQVDIARILNQKGYKYKGQPFTQPRVWHLLNPNGRSERAERVGRQ